MNTSLSILFLVVSVLPGFILFQCFRDAYDEYRHTGKFHLDTLIGNPMLFFLSLGAFVGMLVLSLKFLLGF
ncbi:MAG: hypothetical protein IJ960_06360 [Oscillospiraceae bacterium]|nr:hypothetical protein [Oscillospiraceae bacterium]